MVTQYGMSREVWPDRSGDPCENQYLDGRAVINCGDATAAEIDREVMQMLKDAYEEAKRLLTENREALGQDRSVPDRERDDYRKRVYEDLPRGQRSVRRPEVKKEERIAMKPVEFARIIREIEEQLFRAPGGDSKRGQKAQALNRQK